MKSNVDIKKEGTKEMFYLMTHSTHFNHHTDMIAHTTTFVTPVVEHWKTMIASIHDHWPYWRDPTPYIRPKY